MQTIGERLEDARKRKGISIREAAEATKIRGDYLQRFEGNQFDLGLAEIYVKGFLRSYSHFLGLPADRIINDFNGLGLTASNRGKTPSREVYGRMDLSVASVGEGSTQESSAPTQAEPASAPMRRHPAAFSRGGGQLHQEPSLSPALVLKIALGVLGVVVLILVIWGVKSLFSSSPKSTNSGATSTLQSVPEQTITLTALGPLSVQVVVKNPDSSSGEMLMPNTPLARGEQRVIPWRSAIYITATVWENLQVEVNGKRIPISLRGYDKAQLDGPKTSP